MGLFEEFGEALQDDIQHAAGFAGLDHVDVEGVEGAGVVGHGFREGGAVFDFLGEGGEGGFEDAGLFLLPEDFERAHQREAGILEGGELACELRQDRGGDPAKRDAGQTAGAFPLPSRALWCGFGCFACRFADARGVVALSADFGEGVGGGRGLEAILHGLTGGIDGFVFKDWHARNLHVSRRSRLRRGSGRGLRVCGF